MSTERLPNEVRSTWISRVNNSLCLPPYHLTFVLSYRRPTLVWLKSLNKQRLIKETNISKHLHHKEPLVSCCESDMTCCPYYGTLKCTRKWHDSPSVPHRAASTARWNVQESDTTRCWSKAEPLVGLRRFAMWPVYCNVAYIFWTPLYRLRTGEYIKRKTRVHASFFKQTYRQTQHIYIYIYIYI